MSRLIIYDFEVFRQDVLFGTLIVEDDTQKFFQTWDRNEIKDFYELHKNDMYIGHNCLSYDNGIFEAILKDVPDLYAFSKSIINNNGIRKKYILGMPTYDVMRQSFYSLKLSELCCGKNMHTSEISFDIDRQLTIDEKFTVEEYNKDDLRQTYFNFLDTLHQFELRLDLIKEFGLSKYAINYTEAKIAGKVLHAKFIEGIEDWYVKPVIYDTLQIKNQAVIDFYLSEAFRKGKNMTAMICGCEHKLGAGGIHAALSKVHFDKVMYFDVSGYYNLVMINYDLLPRTLAPEGRELYINMYHEQLKLKKTNPRKRGVFKTVLLAVFGAMMNEYTDLYDPQRGSLVTMTGQLFIIDLLEKLEHLGRVVQSNTDGIMFVPFDWNDEEKVWDIVRAWEERTGFVIKKELKYNLWQRDVNNYVFTVEPDVSEHASSIVEREDYVVCRGEAVGAYWVPIEHSTAGELWTLKEPKAICNGIVDYLVYHIFPEETVKNLKHDLRYFQYTCKKKSFKYCKYEQTDKTTGQIISSEIVADNNRAFANADTDTAGMIYKCKTLPNGKEKKDKIACLPESIFLYNDEILSDSARASLIDRIDWQYYIDRIYERIQEFINFKQVEKINFEQNH